MGTTLGDRYAELLTAQETTTSKTVATGRRNSLGVVLKLTGTGAVTATVKVSGGFDGSNFVEVVSFEMSGTTSVLEGAVEDWPWSWLKLELTAITGTGAALTAQVSG